MGSALDEVVERAGADGHGVVFPQRIPQLLDVAVLGVQGRAVREDVRFEQLDTGLLQPTPDLPSGDGKRILEPFEGAQKSFSHPYDPAFSPTPRPASWRETAWTRSFMRG